MKKSKGFTLIELLAVIVILAVIALIAVPIVLNIIGRVRRSAYERSAESVLKASKSYYTLKQLEPEGLKDVTFICEDDKCLSTDSEELPVEGNIGTGIVSIDKQGNIAFKLTNGTYCAYKRISENKINMASGDCSDIEGFDDSVPPTIEQKSISRINNAIVVGFLVNDDKGVKEIVCKYGESASNLDRIGVIDAHKTSCTMLDVENDKVYYYEIYAVDIGNNESNHLNDDTSGVEAPAIEVAAFKHYNGKNEEITGENLPPYSNHDIVTVTSAQAGSYYVITSVGTTSTVDGIPCSEPDVTGLSADDSSYPGTPNPESCTGTATKDFAAKTWYKIDSTTQLNIDIRFDTKGELAIYMIDENENEAFANGGPSYETSVEARLVKFKTDKNNITCEDESDLGYTSVKCALDKLYEELS